MRSFTDVPKKSRIDFRVSVSQKALIEHAAAVQGMTVSDFVVGASTEAAQLALADQNRFVLSEDQMALFLASLEEEPQVLPKLKDLFSRKSVFE